MKLLPNWAVFDRGAFGIKSIAPKTEHRTQSRARPSPDGIQRRGRPNVNFARRRNEIIQAAALLFAQQGYHATSMSDICKATAVGSGTLYHYVGSKEEILYAIHDRFIDPLLERARLIADTSETPEKTLQELSRELMRTIVEFHYEVTVFLSEWRALTANEARWLGVHAKRRAFELIIQHAIEKGQRTGQFRGLDARLASLAFLGMHDYANQWLRPGGRVPWDAVAELFCDVFLGGITRKAIDKPK